MERIKSLRDGEIRSESDGEEEPEGYDWKFVEFPEPVEMVGMDPEKKIVVGYKWEPPQMTWKEKIREIIRILRK